MSSLADSYVRLAGDLWLGKVSDTEFFSAFSTSGSGVVLFGLQVLEQALATRDPVLVEFGLYTGHRYGFSQGHIGVLLKLAGESWHTQHENVVDGISKLRSPSGADTLYRTALARFEYLEYDEAYALGVKCIWALGYIEGEEAVARLVDLLSCGNAILEDNAAEQLSRIQKEGQSSALRDAAAKALEAKHGRSNQDE